MLAMEKGLIKNTIMSKIPYRNTTKRGMIMEVVSTTIFLSKFLLALAGFAAGFIDTIAGGGGMITLPAYFMFGLPPHVAIGTNKLSGALSVGNAARIFIKKKI